MRAKHSNATLVENIREERKDEMKYRVVLKITVKSSISSSKAYNYSIAERFYESLEINKLNKFILDFIEILNKNKFVPLKRKQAGIKFISTAMIQEIYLEAFDESRNKIRLQDMGINLGSDLGEFYK